MIEVEAKTYRSLEHGRVPSDGIFEVIINSVHEHGSVRMSKIECVRIEAGENARMIPCMSQQVFRSYDSDRALRCDFLRKFKCGLYDLSARARGDLFATG